MVNCAVCNIKFETRDPEHANLHRLEFLVAKIQTANNGAKCLFQDCNYQDRDLQKLVTHILQFHKYSRHLESEKGAEEIIQSYADTVKILKKANQQNSKSKSQNPKSIANSEGKLACDHCGATYKYKSGLLKHRTTVHGNAKTQVDPSSSINKNSPLGQQFSQLLQNGLAKTTTKKTTNFCCGECGKRYISEKTLSNHIKLMHERHKDYNCEECPGKKFASEETLKAHMKNIHEKKENYKCPECTQVLSSIIEREIHLQNTHKINLRPIKCSKCSRSFKEQSHLEQHEKAFHKDTLETANSQVPLSPLRGKNYHKNQKRVEKKRAKWLAKQNAALQDKSRLIVKIPHRQDPNNRGILYRVPIEECNDQLLGANGEKFCWVDYNDEACTDPANPISARHMVNGELRREETHFLQQQVSEVKKTYTQSIPDEFKTHCYICSENKSGYQFSTKADKENHLDLLHSMNKKEYYNFIIDDQKRKVVDFCNLEY